MVIRQADEIPGRERWRELAPQHLRVGEPDPKADHGADIPEYGVADRELELGQVLVGERQTDPILPQFREHAGEAQGREGVKLVEIDIEVPPDLGGDVGTPKAGKTET